MWRPGHVRRSLSSNAERRVQVMIKFRVDSVKNENKIHFTTQDLDRLLGSDLAKPFGESLLQFDVWVCRRH